MDAAEYTIVALNVALALGLGWPLAGYVADRMRAGGGRRRYYVLLILVYLIEAIAFSASMSTNILGILLAVLWGVLLGRRSRRFQLEPREGQRVGLVFALYTCLPAGSFLSVPVVMALSGWSILASHDGVRFGVPDFLPWPLNTILGFSVAVTLVAAALKVTITTGLVRLITERSQEVT